jgi:dihydrofolate reductase
VTVEKYGALTGKVVVDLAMSLDGFIAGASDQPERLHDWMFPASGHVDERNAAVIEASIHRYGAIIMGRHAYDDGDQYDGFVDTPYAVPHFIVTHSAPRRVAKGNTQLFFVTEGIERALERAKAVAGDKDIAIGGGADIAQQYLRAGLVDEIVIALVPVLFGTGLRLFDRLGSERIELECTSMVNAPGVTHLYYRVVKEQ